MASRFEEETIHKQTINIEALKTRSVTLYPSSASIVRDIEGVIIKPGRNEISILGFSLNVDQNTIKVEGHGIDALITDMVVEQILRKSSDSEASEPDLGEAENPELDGIKEEIDNLQQEIEDAEETVKSCSNQVAYIEQHVLGLSTAGTRIDSPTDIDTQSVIENLEHYGKFRAKVYQDYRLAQRKLKELRAEITNKRSEEGRILNAHRVLKKQSLNEKGFPLLVKQVTITIESDSLPENTQSFVSTISTGKPPKIEDDEPPAESYGPSLRVSYIVSGASWKPRYDIRLDTTTETGVLTYRAALSNNTGETWRGAAVTLSTSQTSFTGLEDKAPSMDSWRMSLRKIEGKPETGRDDLYSQKERQMKLWGRNAKAPQGFQQVSAPAQKASGGLFGSAFGAQNTSTGGLFEAAPGKSDACLFGNNTSSSGGTFGNSQLSGGGLFESTNNAPPGPSLPGNSPSSGGGLFGNNQPSGGGLFSNNQPSSGGLFSINPSSGGSLFGNSKPSGDGLFGSNPPSGSGLFGNSSSSGGGLFAKNNNPLLKTGFGQSTPGDPYDSDVSDSSSSGATLNPPGKMGLALGSSQSYGLTTTYDLPGARTIPSSGLFRRHVITEISLPAIKFSHITVPKLRAAVFLKARIRNSSSTPLLKGPVGLTLDGSFLGNSIIGRCAPGGVFELGLGIDEDVLVEYRKPVRKMGSQGVLVKEQVATYERGIRLYNARSKAVKLLVFEQVPISEDERLKIAILNPRGLRNVGDVVKINGTVPECDANAKGSTKEKKDTEEVSVELKKDGEIRYEVLLEKGKEAFLPLEYEAKLPVGETMFGL